MVYVLSRGKAYRCDSLNAAWELVATDPDVWQPRYGYGEYNGCLALIMSGDEHNLQKCGRMMGMTKKDVGYYKFELRSIDAVRAENGWMWNTSHVVEDNIEFKGSDLTPRKILKALREWGYLNERSKGRVRVIDESDLIEVQDKATGEPLYALIMLEKY